MKLDFVIVGAQKAATTTLFNILDRHPQLSGHVNKEPTFFTNTTNWRAGYEEYCKGFKQAEGKKYFEASTSYTFYPRRTNLHIWESMYELNPDMRIIYMVREPIGRITSAYMHIYERGFTDMSLDDAVQHEWGLINNTRYYTQIQPYIQRFGREKVMLIDFDDFNKKRVEVMKSLAEFLQIDFNGFKDFENAIFNTAEKPKYHKKWDNPNFIFRAMRRYAPSLWHAMVYDPKRHFDQKPKMSPEKQEVVFRMLELEIRETGKLMGKDLSHWMKPKG